MIETEHGNFEVIKDYKEALEVKSFNDRYVSYLDKYIYLVGDVSSEKLRLKGFSKKNYKKIPDYLLESCNPNTPYFILKRMK